MYTTYPIKNFRVKCTSNSSPHSTARSLAHGVFCEWYIREHPTCIKSCRPGDVCVCVSCIYINKYFHHPAHSGSSVYIVVLHLICFFFCVFHSHSIPNQLCMYYRMSMAWNFVDKHTDTRIIENRIHSKPLLHIICFGYSWIFGYCRQTCTTITTRRALTHTHMHPFDIWFVVENSTLIRRAASS